MDLGHLWFSYLGRINRAKFWGGYLGLIVPMVLALIAISLLLGEPMTVTNLQDVEATGAEPVMTYDVPALLATAVLGLMALWMSLAVIVKRCHDRGKSGWWALLALIPVVGFIWMLIDLGIMEGDEGPNQYGPNPLAS